MLLLDEDMHDAKRTHETNVWAPLAVTQACVSLFIKAKGTIDFITSVAGHLITFYQGKDYMHGT